MQPMKRACFQTDEAVNAKLKKLAGDMKKCNQSDVVRAAIRHYATLLKDQRVDILAKEVALRVGLKDNRKKIRHRQKKAALIRGEA